MDEFRLRQSPENPRIVIYGRGEGDSKPIVTLTADGQVEFHEGYTPSEAARVFWESLAEANPLRRRVEELTRALGILNEAYEKLRREACRP